MKNFILILVFINVFAFMPLQAQEVLGKEKISYQAIARDATGQVMANRNIEIKASFTSKDGLSDIWFSEHHLITTNEAGVFKLEIGGSSIKDGEIGKVPWGEKAIFLSLEMKQDNGNYQLLNRSQMLSVPYAFHAGKTGKIQDEEQMELRNQSIYWTTTGNEDSRPAYHFIGNRDAQDLYIKTNNTTRAVFSKTGQFQVIAGPTVNGPDTQESSYPVTINGSNQGIWIDIDESRDGDNNYLTFVDETIGILGRVEGQTFPELQATPAYMVQEELFILSGVAVILSAIAHGVEAAGEFASALGAPAGVANIVAIGGIVAEGIALLIESINWATFQAETVGIYYSSGGADYAEFILRAPEERDLFAGQVVGIKNGMVSLNTMGADHLRVISSAPVVLGNMPQAEEEYKFEKVAFRGQVPVFVYGEVNIGDYILPSDNNDGLAVAICPEDMKAEDYKYIIGVAWSAAEFSLMNLVNVAIGINSNDLGYKLDELDQKVNNIYSYLQGTGSLDDLESVQKDQNNDAIAVTEKAQNIQNPLGGAFTEEEFDQFLQENEAVFHEIYSQAKKSLIIQGYDLSKYPEIAKMLDNPLPFIKEVRKNPNYLTQWASMDLQIQKAAKRN